jgi:hypothetical protein
MYRIWGFHSGSYECCHLLAHSAVQSNDSEERSTSIFKVENYLSKEPACIRWAGSQENSNILKYIHTSSGIRARDPRVRADEYAASRGHCDRQDLNCVRHDLNLTLWSYCVINDSANYNTLPLICAYTFLPCSIICESNVAVSQHLSWHSCNELYTIIYELCTISKSIVVSNC